MRIAVVAVAAGLACAFAGPTCAEIATDVARAHVAALVENFVRPGYQRFDAAARALRGDVETLCAAPSQPALDAAREKFRTLVAAWSSAEVIRVGPVTEKGRLERLLYWPDRKGIGLKQVQAIVAVQDRSAANPVTLQAKSVAVQGLVALEFTLFGTGADQLSAAPASFRCAYAAAIAANIGLIAGDLDREWSDPTGFAAAWKSPGPDNPLYRSGDEAEGDILDTILHGLELVRDVRLGGFLGKDDAPDKSKQALFWRSDATVASLAGNLAALREVFASSEIAASLPADQGWIADSIRFEFGNAISALAAIDKPVAEALADPGLRAKLDYARLVTSSLSELVGNRLAAELGLTAGFSSLDGD
jgi:uncharacterized protein